MSAPLRARLVAGAFGLCSHGAFAFALHAMARALWAGMGASRGRLEGGAALAANALLVLQFPLVHSWLLTNRGRRALKRLAPREHAATLAPTTYALVASLQLWAAFTLWSPSGVVLWRPAGWQLALHAAAFATAWLALGLSLWQAGLGLQTGWIGWRAVWAGRPPAYPPLPERGVFARCRQPIYLGFALVLWTAPTWTIDRIALASAWSIYCVVGPLHKERRYLRLYGERFRSYRERVPYFLPRIKS